MSLPLPEGEGGGSFARVACGLLLCAGCTCQPIPFTPDAGDSGFDAGPIDSGVPDAGPRDAGTLADAGSARCADVACAGAFACDTSDGVCRCNGVECGAAETCTCPAGVPGCQPSERVCEASTRCDGATCSGGTVCDQRDGQCKCGAGGPTCSDAQVCGAARPPQCIGGCAAPCDRGLSCDSDDQECKCGGRGGLLCAPEEICVSSGTHYACRLPCNVTSALCPSGQQCFVDVQPSLQVIYCAWPSGLRFEGEACARSTECLSGGCAGLSAMNPMGVCRDACDFGARACAAGRHCEALRDIPNAGFCVP